MSHKLYVRNIQGLPFRNIAHDRIRAAWRHADYVMLQECFTFFGPDVGKLTSGFPYWYLYAPSWVPGMGSGLLSMSRRERADRLISRIYPRGTLRSALSKLDVFALKGFVGWRYEWGWLFQTHLDAGGEPADVEQRRIQLRVLSQWLPKGPLIVCGDFNLKRAGHNRPRVAADQETMRDFTDAADLSIAGWNDVDAVLARGIEPTVTVGPDDRLSDHRGLVVEW